LHTRFENEAIGQARIEAGREGGVGIELSLAEELGIHQYRFGCTTMRGAYVVCSIERKKGVGRQHLTTGGEGMADLEEWVY
jgi:hypothetical protein